jgi:hypothetical protein
MTIREYIEASTDEPILLADGLDDALLGMTDDSPHRAVYSVRKILDMLIVRDGMSEPEAVEFYEFNIAGAYLGEHTPIYVRHP